MLHKKIKQYEHAKLKEQSSLCEQNMQCKHGTQPKQNFQETNEATNNTKQGLQENQADIYADLILMDDGFQHFALERDYNIVLLDKDDLFPQNPLGFLWERRQNWNRVIPLGSWREQKCALHRASIFLLKCPCDEWSAMRKNIIKTLSIYQKPLFIFQIILDSLENIFDKECTQELAKKHMSSEHGFSEHTPNKHESDKQIIDTKQDYALLCAVANPEQVQRSIEKFMGYKPTKVLFFADHHDFKKEGEALRNVLKMMPIICTEKDAVKLEYFDELRHAHNAIYRVRSHVEFYTSEFYENFDTLSSLDNSLSARLSSTHSHTTPTSFLSVSPTSHFDHWIEEKFSF